MRVRKVPVLACLTVGMLLVNGCATVPDTATPAAAQETPTRAPDEQPTSAPGAHPRPLSGLDDVLEPDVRDQLPLPVDLVWAGCV